MEEFLGEGCCACARIRYRRGEASPVAFLTRLRSEKTDSRPPRDLPPRVLEENIMTEDTKVVAEVRTSFGKGFARRLVALPARSPP